MTREQVIELINKMRELNQREKALETYAMCHAAYPEWNLQDVVWLEMKGKE